MVLALGAITGASTFSASYTVLSMARSMNVMNTGLLLKNLDYATTLRNPLFLLYTHITVN